MPDTTYIGVFLTPESRELLLSTYPPKHKEIHADHMTIKFMPSRFEVENLAIGQKVKLKVIGYGWDQRVDAVLVHGVMSDNWFPHITLSVDREKKGKPSHSNDMFGGPGLSALMPSVIERFEKPSLILDGIIDTFPRSTTQQSKKI